MIPDNLKRLSEEIIENNVRMVKIGMDSVETRYRPAIQLLEREFLASLMDKDTKMKTSLQLAIQQVISLLPSSITDKVNAYADSKIQQDIRTRHEGRPDHDMDTCGRKVA